MFSIDSNTTKKHGSKDREMEDGVYVCMDLHHHFRINTLRGWDKPDKKLKAVVGFNVNHKH